jgi:hypothetical protein
MIDSVEYVGETMVVASGIAAAGTERAPELRQGVAENAAACAALIGDLALLVDRITI